MPGWVKIISLQKLFSSNRNTNEEFSRYLNDLNSFPGPLTSSGVSQDKVKQFIANKIYQLQNNATSNVDVEGRRLLWEFLSIYIDYCGI
jgi:hypothetical protein